MQIIIMHTSILLEKQKRKSTDGDTVDNTLRHPDKIDETDVDRSSFKVVSSDATA